MTVVYTFSGSLDSGLVDNNVSGFSIDYSGNKLKVTPDSTEEYGSTDTNDDAISIDETEVLVLIDTYWDYTGAAYLGGTELNLEDSSGKTLIWYSEANFIGAGYNNGSGLVNVYSLGSFSDSDYQGLRIRETGGTFYWDSWSGSSWTNRASSSSPTIDHTAVQAKLVMGRYGAGTGNPAYSEFDDLTTPEVASVAGHGLLLPSHRNRLVIPA